MLSVDGSTGHLLVRKHQYLTGTPELNFYFAIDCYWLGIICIVLTCEVEHFRKGKPIRWRLIGCVSLHDKNRAVATVQIM